MSTDALTLRAAVVRRSTLAVETALVLGSVALIALCAQIAIPTPLSPAPFTLQTFAVLSVAAALGSVRGALSTLLYVAVGAAGAPVFAGASSGTHVLFGATGGYLIGMVVAASVVGWLSERFAMDRRLRTSVLAMAASDGILLLIGTAWLAQVLHIDAWHAFLLGTWPFLLVEALKVAAAAGLLPSVWAMLRRLEQRL
ncbi:MAG: biotin transporter BioY [Actinomycetales bacterium]